MTITIHLQTAEEFKILEPLLQVIQKANTATIHIQSDVTAVGERQTDSDSYVPEEQQEGIQELLNYVQTTQLPIVEKIMIPSREERNAR